MGYSLDNEKSITEAHKDTNSNVTFAPTIPVVLVQVVFSYVFLFLY